MNAAGQRKRTLNRRYYDTDDDEHVSDAQLGLSPKRNGSSRPRPSAVEDTDWTEELLEDQQAGGSDCDNEDLEGDSEEGSEGACDEEREAAGVLLADLCRCECELQATAYSSGGPKVQA